MGSREGRGRTWVSLAVTGTLLLALAVLGGTKKVWPFCYWDMYSKGHYPPARVVESFQLRVRDVRGGTHLIWPRDIFTLDDDSSGQPSGPALVGLALRKGATVQERGLVTRAAHIIGEPVASLEVWQLTWKVNFDTYPPYRVTQPTTEKRLKTLTPEGGNRP